jgi:hypothetical protein
MRDDIARGSTVLSAIRPVMAQRAYGKSTSSYKQSKFSISNGASEEDLRCTVP